MKNIKAYLPRIDFQDVCFLAGIGSLGTGLWWIDPSTSLIVVGSVLLIFSVLPAVLSIKKDSQ